MCSHHPGQGHQAQVLWIISCLLLLVCFESLNLSDTTCSRTISGRICSDKLRIGVYSPPLLELWETLQVSTVKTVLLFWGRTFLSFSGLSLRSLIFIIQCFFNFSLISILFSPVEEENLYHLFFFFFSFAQPSPLYWKVSLWLKSCKICNTNWSLTSGKDIPF